MTILTPERLAEIAALAKKATPGPWEADSMKSEESFNAFKVTNEKGNTICDTLNSDISEVNVEYDEDSAMAWDEVGRRNTAFIAALDPQTVLALLASRAALQAEVERLRKVEASCIQLVENATNARVEAIEAHRLRRIAQTEAAHASESAAREMRERCVKEAKTHEETARELLNRAKADGHDRLADNHEGAADDVEKVARISAIVDEQANDPGLWFQAETAAEAYVQQALRRLHAAIEGKTPDECARAALSALGGWNEAVEAAAQIAENHRLAHAKGGPRDDAAYCFKSAEIRDQIRALRRPATGEGDQTRKTGE